jgi:RimJ/RimL family protein N-acetyltransferase
MRRVFGTCDPRNVATGQVLRRVEIDLRAAAARGAADPDGWRDSDVYGLPAHEWAADREGLTPGGGLG